MYTNILVLDDGTEIQANQTGSTITNLVYTATVSSTTDLCPGAACAAKIEFTVWVQPGSSLAFTSGTRVKYYQEDAGGSRTLVGTFWAVKPTKQTRNSYKVYAYDAVSKLDGIQSSWLRSIQDDFPMSLWSFAQAVAQQCGVTLANSSLPRSGSYQVQAFYGDNLTGRQLLGWVAEASCTFLRATPSGGIEFAWYTTNTQMRISPDGQPVNGVQAVAYRDGGLSYEDYQTATIDKVQIKQSDDDVGVIYPANEMGTNALVIKGNLLLTTSSAALLQPVAQSIYTAMQGITYTPLKVSLFSNGVTFAPGQIVTVEDPQGNILQTYVMTVQRSGAKISLESTGNASRDGTAAVNEEKLNLNGKILEISATVDGLNIKASDLEGNFSQLQQTVDGLSLTVSKTSDRDLFGDAAWASGTAGAVVDGKSVTLTTSSAGRARATLDVQKGNLEEIGEGTFVVSVDYRITAEVNTGSDTSGIAFWMDYPDGNVSQWVKVIYSGNGSTAPVQDWQTAQIEVTGKAQPPTRTYLYAYLNAGTGAVELRDPVMYQKTAGSSISLTSNGIVIGTASDIVQVDETRDAFAQSDHSVTIDSGTITFAANTLVVDSDNFKLSQDGTVSITGDFFSQTEDNKVSIYSGQLRLERKVSDGQWKNTVDLWSYGSNAANGMLYLYGPGADGNQVFNVNLFSSYSGGGITVYNASQQQKFQVLINSNGDAEVWVNGVKRF